MEEKTVDNKKEIEGLRNEILEKEKDLKELKNRKII